MIKFSNIKILPNKINKQSFSEKRPSVDTFAKAMLQNLTDDVFCKNNDGKISDKTFKKVQEILTSTVNADNPIESAVFVYQDKIIYAKLGEKRSVDIGDFSKFLSSSPDLNISMLHSHPRKSPHSFQDYKVFYLRPGLSQMYVIAPDGEYYLMRKTKTLPEYSTILQTEQEYEKYTEEAIVKKNKKIEKLEKKISKQYDKLMVLRTESYLNPNETREEEQKINAKIKEIKEEYDFYKSDNYYCQKVNEFWQKNAQKLGIEIETNYSNLSK